MSIFYIRVMLLLTLILSTNDILSYIYFYGYEKELGLNCPLAQKIFLVPSLNF